MCQCCGSYHTSEYWKYFLCRQCCCTCCFNIFLAQEYSGKHIVGISGRTGGLLDQLTFHYSDGTTTTVGANGGVAVPIQTFDPAVEGHIIKIEWDPRDTGRNGKADPFLGGGFRFHLSGGRVIQIAGGGSRWNSNDWRMARRDRIVDGPEPLTKEDGTIVHFGLLDLQWYHLGGKGTGHIPTGASWQQLPHTPGQSETAMVAPGQKQIGALPDGGAQKYAKKQLERLEEGQDLNIGDCLMSPNGKYKAIMQSDGNFVVYSGDSDALWASNTTVHQDFIGKATLQQSDKHFVIHISSSVLWSSGQSDSSWDGQHFIAMQDDGNLVQYVDQADADHVVWSTNTIGGVDNRSLGIIVQPGPKGKR